VPAVPPAVSSVYDIAYLRVTLKPAAAKRREACAQ
jgi:hypothetical protein